MPILDKKSHANKWADAFSSLDIERMLAFYAENVQYSTPRAASILGLTTINDKDTLRSVWSSLLEKATSAHFRVDNVIQDGNVLAIFYSAEVNNLRYRACERQTLNDEGIVTEGEAMYGISLI